MVKEKIEYQYLSSDLVAKHIFGTTKNKRFLIHFLELYYNLEPGTLKKLKVENSITLNQETIKSKRFEMDILILLPNGNKINIEFQQKLDITAFIKNFAYACGIIYKLYKRGDDLTDIFQVTQLNIVDNFEYKNYKEFNSELLEIKYIDIAKYRENIYNKNIEIKELDVWLMLISARNKKELKEVLKLSEGYPMIKEVVEEMDNFQSNEYVQEWWWQDKVNKTRYKLGMKESFNEGKNTRELEIARKMLSANEPIDKIQEFTELSLKEINKLKKSL